MCIWITPKKGPREKVFEGSHPLERGQFPRSFPLTKQMSQSAGNGSLTPWYSLGPMSKFRFRSVDGSDIAPEKWLPMWAALYPEIDFRGYDELLIKHKSFSSTDIEEIGKWKDAATGGRWRPNVASVAYPIWMAAASKPPKCPEKNEITQFLSDWSERKYRDEYANG